MSSHASFEGFSDPRTCPEALLNASRVCVLLAAASASLAAAPGSDVFNILLPDSASVGWNDSGLADLQW